MKTINYERRCPEYVSGIKSINLFETRHESIKLDILNINDLYISCIEVYIDDQQINNYNFDNIDTDLIELIFENGDKFIQFDSTLKIHYTSGREYHDFKGVILKYYSYSFKFNDECPSVAYESVMDIQKTSIEEIKLFDDYIYKKKFDNLLDIHNRLKLVEEKLKKLIL